MKKLSLTTLVVLCLLSFTSKATVIYVDSTHIDGTQTGTFWSTAFSDFQQGINAANAGDTVWVALGTYLAPMNGSFMMKEGVKIFGGFLNSDTAFLQRDWLNNITILSLNDNNTHTQSIISNDSNNLSRASLIDGFTFTQGAAFSGRGMYNKYASPTISNCIFRDMILLGFGDTVLYNAGGGGIYNSNASPCIRNSSFINNYGHNSISAPAFGSAIYNEQLSTPVIEYCLFRDNDSGGSGGAIYSNGGSISITHCKFENNTAAYGGAINSDHVNVNVSNTIFEGNSGDIEGGAIYGDFQNDSIKNCSFINNRSLGIGLGGAIYMISGVSNIINSLFLKNIGINGGAIRVDGNSKLFVTNCTLFGGQGYGSGINNSAFNEVTVTNTIIWGGIGTGFFESGSPTTSTITYSLINGMSANASDHVLDGNTNPQFVDTAGSNFHLKPGSPCIDAGSNSAYLNIGGHHPLSDLDLGDSARLKGANIDLGAYEWPAPANPSAVSTPEEKSTLLKVIPNPAKESIYITFTNDKLLQTKAMLTDIYGRVVCEMMLNSNPLQISLAGLIPGIYILKTLTGDSVKITKE